MKTHTARLGATALAVSLSFVTLASAAPPPPSMARNVNPGAASSQIFETVDVNGTFYFSALSEEFGKELWKSDGTKHGTVMVKDIYPGLYGVFDNIPSGIWSNPEELTNVAGTLFFAAESPAGFALWKSDGTEAGTVMVSDQVFPDDMVAAGSLAFFTPGNQLWVSDGTESGTVPLTGLTPGVPPYDGYDPIAVGTTVYFSATDGVTSKRRQLWKTDGTVAGTSQVTTFGGANEIQDTEFVGGAFGSLLLFSVCDITCPDVCYDLCQLWRTDGTGPGTFALTSLAGSGGLGPTSRAVDAGSLAFLTVYGSGTGEELWKTDGTVLGTGIVTDLLPGPDDSQPEGLTALGGAVYFLVDELFAPGLGGLWRSDGTALGTTQVAAFQVDDLAYGYDLVNAGGTLLFRTQIPDGRSYLWRSDGTPGGTEEVSEFFGHLVTGHEFTPVGGALFFVALAGDPYGFEPMVYLASCGDGSVGTGEQCDSGAMNGLDGICTAACIKVNDVDDDGVLNADDNCEQGWNPGQEDGDGDGEGDACEACVGGGAATKQQIKLSKLNTLIADDKLTMKGVATVTTTPWVGPDLKGAIVRIEDSTGAPVLHAEIPGYEYDPDVYLDGWKTNGSYTSFTYLNKNPGGLLGLIKVGLKIDLTTGVLKFAVKGKNGSFGFDPGNLPLTGIVALDTEKPVVGQCAVATFPNPPGTPGSCTLKPDGSSLKCK